MLTCILLAAGESQRFGSPKSLASINSDNVIVHLQKKLIDSRVDEIIIVLGAHADLIKPHILHHNKITVVYNKSYILGQTSSFQTGIKKANSSTEAFMLQPVDVPFIKTCTINNIIDEFYRLKKHIIVPAFKGKKGHPPIFDCSLKKEILELSVSEGLNAIVHEHQKTDESIVEFNDPGIVATFNTIEEWENLKKVFSI